MDLGYDVVNWHGTDRHTKTRIRDDALHSSRIFQGSFVCKSSNSASGLFNSLADSLFLFCFVNSCGRDFARR